MPFTGSHPAIILPLLRWRIFSASGLLMGSMVPDFEYFLRLDVNGVHGHSILPMFWLNLPTSILCIFIYHYLVRDQLILNLPGYFRRKFQPFSNFDWFAYFKSNYIMVGCSILIGNLSHLFWDAFTHSDGFFVGQVSIFSFTLWQVPIYDVLQYSFSLFGALSILRYITQMPDFKLRQHSSFINKLFYWFVVLFVTVFIYFIRYDSQDYEKFTARIVFICAGFLAGLVVASSLFKVKSLNNEIIPLKNDKQKTQTR